VRKVSHSVGFSVWPLKIYFIQEQNDGKHNWMNIFQQLLGIAEPCMEFTSLSSAAWQVLSTNILQGSVATHLKYGAIFNYYCTTNLLLSLP